VALHVSHSISVLGLVSDVGASALAAWRSIGRRSAVRLEEPSCLIERATRLCPMTTIAFPVSRTRQPIESHFL
jgi:hypothetical protein